MGDTPNSHYIFLACTIIVIGCGGVVMVCATVWFVRTMMRSFKHEPSPVMPLESPVVPRRSRAKREDETTPQKMCPKCGTLNGVAKMNAADGKLNPVFNCECGATY